MKKQLFSIFLILTTVFMLVSCDTGESSVLDSVNTDGIYEVKYETNGGSYIAPEYVSQLDAPPKEPTKENSVFCGWYIDESLTVPADFPLLLVSNTTLYAKWVKTSHKVLINDTISLKAGSFDYGDTIIGDISTNEFDYPVLEDNGYTKMKITVNYSVRYKKSYSLGIGYFGAPEYNIYMRYGNHTGYSDEDIKATSSSKAKSASMTASFELLKDKEMTLKFSTQNIQNIVYIENISVYYECIK